MDDVTITRNEQRSRFEARVDGQLAGFADYAPRGEGVVVMPHTEVDPAFGGRGLGTRLVRGALDQLREDGVAVVPACSFVASFIDQHPEYADLLAR